MKTVITYIFCIHVLTLRTEALDLEYLDPIKLQTRVSSDIQERTALELIRNYFSQDFHVSVNVSPVLFHDKKDVFAIRSNDRHLDIRASTGVAAVWGFNYFLKKYCKSQIAWQTERVKTPDPLPEVDEFVIANDRFRYYQNVHTATYSFVWWSADNWISHVKWMALNGINLALAPIAQEAIWTNVYHQIGMTQEEIDDHFTGPAFLSSLRTGNMRGWQGPLHESWHERQKDIQDRVLTYMFNLGMIPVLPAFNGHVPKAFSRIYPNATFHQVGRWNNFDDDNCCNLFLHPSNPEFKEIGKMFLKEVTTRTGLSHMYIAEPFNEVNIQPWSTNFVRDTAIGIYSTLNEIDNDAVWVVPNWMLLQTKNFWPESTAMTFLTSVPSGRILVLDLQSEQRPQYDTYEMYYGQPFIWCMLHNFGGTSGMFGNMKVINTEVYDARSRFNGTMIGIGLTPEGINQNYVMYDLMLESAWRDSPVKDLEAWAEDYAERRYGCNNTAGAWKYLLRSVYSLEGQNKLKGKYVITQRPTFGLQPSAWYSSQDLFKAFKKLIFISNDDCLSQGYYYDVVDVTRQALQYRAEQIYLKFKEALPSEPMFFNATINRFLDVMEDIQSILATHPDFSGREWFRQARSIGRNTAESYLYEMCARNQITLWGPKGERADYASKQWTEMFKYYYTPRWRLFLNLALKAVNKYEHFNEDVAQNIVRSAVEERFLSIPINAASGGEAIQTALTMYGKWAHVSDLIDLPRDN